MNKILDINTRPIEFSVLVGTESAELRDNNRLIVGKWAERLGVWRGGAPTLSERFLNSPSDAKSILRFTKSFGPLSYPFERDPSKTRSFQLHVDEWREFHKRLARWWDMLAGFPSMPATTQIAPTVIETVPRDQFQIGPTALTFRCANLWHYMLLEVAGFPAVRLRICGREGCSHRFVARDRRERYCSDRCSAIGKNRAKLRYWNMHKEAFLAERKEQRLKGSKRRRKENGTSQTR